MGTMITGPLLSLKSGKIASALRGRLFYTVNRTRGIIWLAYLLDVRPAKKMRSEANCVTS